jgi:sulfur-oxidizing protein SoxY
MDHLRRDFLKSMGAVSAMMALFSAGLLKSGELFAATWNNLAFTAKDTGDAMKNAGYGGAVESADIMIKAPNIAENGAVVPIEVTSNIPGTSSIAIFVEKNPNPMIADFEFTNGAEPFIATRVKMASTSIVRAAVKADGKVYTNTREVKVTIGGCGG